MPKTPNAIVRVINALKEWREVGYKEGIGRNYFGAGWNFERLVIQHKVELVEYILFLEKALDEKNTQK